MLVIGLTGGIGTGKTTVANLFAALGVPIIDADVIAKTITERGRLAYDAIVEHFSPAILKQDKTLDRSKLREIIFNVPNEKIWLENLLHPIILSEAKIQAAKITAPYCIIVIPLLIEISPLDFIDRILVVDLPQEMQHHRTMKRDQVSAEQVEKIIRAQASRAKRLATAHDLILNEGTLDDLAQQVQNLHQKYLEISQE